jgi:hypothetical protein
MTDLTLIHVPVSHYSEKARWTIRWGAEMYRRHR